MGGKNNQGNQGNQGGAGGNLGLYGGNQNQTQQNVGGMKNNGAGQQYSQQQAPQYQGRQLEALSNSQNQWDSMSPELKSQYQAGGTQRPTMENQGISSLNRQAPGYMGGTSYGNDNPSSFQNLYNEYVSNPSQPEVETGNPYMMPPRPNSPWTPIRRKVAVDPRYAPLPSVAGGPRPAPRPDRPDPRPFPPGYATPRPQPPRPPMSCFLAGTKIAMSDGTEKDIENVVVGDTVKAFDIETGEVIDSPVPTVFVHPNTKGYYIINNNINVTGNHPMRVDDEWKDVDNLKVGDKLHHLDGSKVNVETIDKIEDTVTTYNFEVKNVHNYFANKHLVHNKSLPVEGPRPPRPWDPIRPQPGKPMYPDRPDPRPQPGYTTPDRPDPRPFPPGYTTPRPQPPRPEFVGDTYSDDTGWSEGIPPRPDMFTGGSPTFDESAPIGATQPWQPGGDSLTMEAYDNAANPNPPRKPIDFENLNTENRAIFDAAVLKNQYRKAFQAAGYSESQIAALEAANNPSQTNPVLYE